LNEQQQPPYSSSRPFLKKAEKIMNIHEHSMRRIADLERVIRDKSDTIQSLERQVQTLTQQVGHFEELHRRVLGSRSWRITAPLRLLGSLWHAIRSGLWQTARAPCCLKAKQDCEAVCEVGVGAIPEPEGEAVQCRIQGRGALWGSLTSWTVSPCGCGTRHESECRRYLSVTRG